ncbi:MAG: hypothetical protein KJ623_02015 [Nanoarchaeota archaeon]|nr:hypothetical protein [Nanoarchaeota archaeon]MBU0962791.1 hypothetical protein [Nanoarchaeota archaeon]
MTEFIRDIAYRTWIKDLKNGAFFEKQSELEPNYILINNKKISRVYLIASVIQKFENEDSSYANITIDDGSSDIRLKVWKNDVELISDILISNLILVIGKIKKYEDEIYIVPEIVKKVDPNWELVHKLILLKEPKHENIEKEKSIEKPEEISFK